MANEPSTTRHRFIRFRLRTLLLLPLLFALGWWWVTWPERTAKRFAELLTTGDIEAARALCDEQFLRDGFWLLAGTKEAAYGQPKEHEPTWRELGQARRRFVLSWKLNTLNGDINLVANRGRISREPITGPSLFVVVQLTNMAATDMATILSQAYSDVPNQKVIADTHTNQVLILGSESQNAVARALIAELEKASSDSVASKEQRQNIFRHPVYRPSEQPAKIIRPGP